MELIILGFLTFVDFAILKWKLERKRYGDFALDLGMLVIVMTFFHDSMTTMIIGVVAQFIMSFYLLISPPKFLRMPARGAI